MEILASKYNGIQCYTHRRQNTVLSCYGVIGNIFILSQQIYFFPTIFLLYMKCAHTIMQRWKKINIVTLRCTWWQTLIIPTREICRWKSILSSFNFRSKTWPPWAFHAADMSSHLDLKYKKFITFTAEKWLCHFLIRAFAMDFLANKGFCWCIFSFIFIQNILKQFKSYGSNKGNLVWMCCGIWWKRE